MMNSTLGEGSLPAISPGLAAAVLGPAFELKFQLSAAEAEYAEAWARAHLAPDCHGADGFYRVTSIYCDTPSFDVFHRNSGFKRRKFRVRRYGEAGHVFLERKAKNGDRVRKKRVQVDASELPYLDDLMSDPNWSGAWFHRKLVKRSLRPAVRVSYERTAFMGHAGEMPVRLTLDRNLVGRPANSWDLVPLLDGQPLLHGAVLLELKYHVMMPELFRDLLPKLPAQPARVSKYRRCVHLCGLAEPRVKIFDPTTAQELAG